MPPPVGTLLVPRGPGRCRGVVQGLEHLPCRERHKLTRRKLHLHTVRRDQRCNGTNIARFPFSPRRVLLKFFICPTLAGKAGQQRAQHFTSTPADVAFAAAAAEDASLRLVGFLPKFRVRFPPPSPGMNFRVTGWQSVRTSSSDSDAV